MSSSLMRSFDKKRYAALVFAQSWQASGMLSPTAAPICSSKLPNLLPRRRSSNSQPAISCSIQLFAWAAERPRALSRPSLHIMKAPLRRDSGAQEGITNDSSDSRIRKIASAERRGEMWVIESHGPARQRGKRDEADCDPIGSIRMLPNSFYGFDDAAVRKRIGKWDDASPDSRLRIGKRNRAATNSASNRMAGQAVSCAGAAQVA